jgi:hypothetical protein
MATDGETKKEAPALDKLLLRAPQYTQLQQFFEVLKANQKELRKSVQLTTDQKGETLEQVEKLEAKTVTVEHRKGFDDEDVSGWDDRLSRADFVDVSGMKDRLTNLDARLTAMDGLKQKVETQKDAVNTAAEQATATLTEQATKTEELQQAQKRVDNELNKEDGVVARTTALDAKLKELQKKAEAVAKEKKAIWESVRGEEDHLDGLEKRWRSAADAEERSKRGQVDHLIVHLEHARKTTLTEAVHLYQYAVDAMVEARAEKRTRLLNSWRQGSAEAIAGVTVRGENKAKRGKSVSSPQDRVALRGCFAAWRCAVALVGDLPPEPQPDVEEVSPEMSVQYNGFLYCVLPAIAKDAALTEVTGPQTLIPGWEPVPEKLKEGEDLDELLEAVVWPYGWGAEVVALECPDMQRFGLYHTKNAGGSHEKRLHGRSDEHMQWRQGRAVSHYNRGNIRMLLRRPIPSASWARPAVALINDGTVVTNVHMNAAPYDSGRGPKPVISAMKMVPSLENIALDPKEPFKGPQASRWAIIRGVGADWAPSTAVGTDAWGTDNSRPIAFRPRDRDLDDDAPARVVKEQMDGDGEIRRKWMEIGKKAPRHVRSRVEKGVAALNRGLNRSLLLGFRTWWNNDSAEAWFEARTAEVEKTFPDVDAHLEEEREDTQPVRFAARKAKLEARLGGADGDPLAKLLTVETVAAAVTSRLEDYTKLAEPLGAPADKLLGEHTAEVEKLRAMVQELEAGEEGRAERVAEFRTGKNSSCRELFKVIEHKATKVDVKGVVQDVLLLWKAIEGLEKSKTDRAELASLRKDEDEDSRKQDERLATFIQNGKHALEALSHEFIRSLQDVEEPVEEHTAKFQALQEMLKKLSFFVEEMVTKLTKLSADARQRLRPSGMVRTGGGFKRASESRVMPARAQIERPPRLGDALSAGSLEDGCNRWLQYANNMLEARD